MKKKIQNLERLHAKMQARYGQQDPMVQQLQDDVVRMKAMAEILVQRRTASHATSASREQRAGAAR